MTKNISIKILTKFVRSKSKVCPHRGKWSTAYGLLLEGYENRNFENSYYEKIGEYKLIKKIEYPPRPSKLNFHGRNVHYKNLQFALSKQIMWLKKLNDQEATNKFGGYLTKLKESEWISSVYKPDGSKIKKRTKKTAKESMEELLANPKRLLKARRIIRKEELLKKNKFK